METLQTGQEVRLQFVDYWRVLRARWVIALVVFLLVLLTTGVVTYFQTRYYFSACRIKVEQERLSIPVFEQQQIMSSYDPFFLQTQYEIIQSQKILYPVMESLGLQHRWGEDLTPDYIFRRLKKQLSVQRFRDTTLIQIGVFDEEAQTAADIANKIAEVFERERLEVKREQTVRGLEKLREELVQQRKKVQEAQEQVERLRHVPMYGQIKLSDETLRQLEQQLTQTKIEAVGRQTRLEELKKLDKQQLRNAIVTVVNDPNIQVLLQNLTDAERQLEELKEDFGPEHPNVRVASVRRDKLREQLDGRVDGMLHGFEVDYQMALSKVDELQKQMEEAKKASLVLEAAHYRPFRNAQLEEEMETRLYEVLNQRLKQVSIELEVPRSPVELIDRAIVVHTPVKPDWRLNMGLGSLFGLILGIGLAFFMEVLDTSIKKMEDIEKYLGLPSLGVVAQQTGSLVTGAASVTHVEAYRMLRTNIEFAKGDASIHSFCILSSGAGEGKSFTSGNLACVYAQHGAQVLLVDADMRRPTGHKVFDMTNEIGLADYLAGAKTLEEVIRPTHVTGVSIITAGSRANVKSALPMLTSMRMKDLIHEAGRRYAIALYDTPPVLAASDAAVLAREVGMAILVVQHRRYPRTMPRRARQIIENSGGKVLGVVVNNVHLEQADTYHYYHDQYEDYLHANERRPTVAVSTATDPSKPMEGDLRLMEKY